MGAIKEGQHKFELPGAMEILEKPLSEIIETLGFEEGMHLGMAILCGFMDLNNAVFWNSANSKYKLLIAKIPPA